MRQVRIEDVIVPQRGIPVEDLPDGLSKKLYNEPILVLEDLTLVDGLRRLRWHQANGDTYIEAIVTSDWLEIVEALTRAHAGRSPSYRRVWEIHKAVRDIGASWAKIQSGGGWIRRPGEKAVRVSGRNPRVKGQQKYSPHSSIPAFMKAVSIDKDHTLGDIIFLYRRGEREQRARDLIAQVEAGEVTLVGAINSYRRPHNLIGHVTKLPEQRQILERGIPGLEGQVAALRKLGFPLSLSTEEVASARTRLEQVQRELYQFTNGLKKWEKENG